MTRALVLSGLTLWAGAALLLSTTRWFSRVSLEARIRPYVVGGMAGRHRAPQAPAATVREALRPLAGAIGERLARVIGAGEDLDVRLARIHSPLDASAFRVRQVGYAVVAFTVVSLVTLAFRPPVVAAVPMLLVSPLVAFVGVEQQLAAASRRWRRRLFLELPVIAEQLAMLLSAGYSLTAALDRIASRGRGCGARDLRRVLLRVRQGLSDVHALREWSLVAGVDAVGRLVSVLALNRETSDLGRLLSAEARAIRRDVHRQVTELAERRGQQVWIPVTVATLVPGVMFLAIPFLTALRLFAG